MKYVKGWVCLLVDSATSAHKEEYRGIKECSDSKHGQRSGTDFAEGIERRCIDFQRRWYGVACTNASQQLS